MKKIKNIFSNLPKKTIAIIGSIAIALALGITSTIRSYNEKTHGDYVIASDSVYSKLSGTTDLILTSLAKETDSVARSRTDNVITFVVKGKNTKSDMEVNYEVQLDEGKTVSGKTRLDTSNLKFDLVETIDGTETTVVDAETFSSLNSTGIYTNQIAHGTSDEETRTYKLRVWVSSSSSVTTETIANSYISVHVKIAGSFYQDPTDFGYTKIANLAAGGANYIAQYTGTHNDSLAGNGDKNIYYYTGSSSTSYNNVIFAGFCWQILRTTDTGGVRMIYNGIPTNGSCSTKAREYGVVTYEYDSDYYATYTPARTYAYGTSYTYDISTRTFKLAGDIFIDPNEGTYAEDGIIHKYSCFNADPTATCTYLRYVIGTTGNTNGPSLNVQTYTIPTSYTAYSYEDAIGYISFNSTQTYASVRNYVGSAGYMFGDNYQYYPLVYSDSKDDPYYTYGYGVTWDGEKYTLVTDYHEAGTSSGTYYKHYACKTTTNNVYLYDYVYYIIRSTSSTNYYQMYYVKLTNGDLTPINQLNYILKDNSTDSQAKTLIEAWYKNNLLDYTNYLEDSVYCNDRSITDLGGYDYTNATNTSILRFNTDSQVTNSTTNLYCANLEDRFSVGNTAAHLTYPIAMATYPEMMLLDNTMRKTGNGFFSIMSPKTFSHSVEVGVIRTTDGGFFASVPESMPRDIRPVITLKYNVEFSSVGDGSLANPYRVREPCTIDSCPGCKYTYKETSLWTKWNTRSQTATVLSSNDYKEDYHDVISESGYNYFLGVKLNGSNQIEKAYACGLKDNTTPFCIEGTVDGSAHSDNTSVLQSSSLWNGACSTGNYVTCEGSIRAYSDYEGAVSVTDNTYGCYVDYDGRLICGDWE